MASTPGPWGFAYDGSSNYSIGPEADPQVDRIGTLYGRQVKIEDVQLIAAAPELLEAAKGLLDDISGEVRDPLNLDLEARPEDDPLIAMKWIKALAQAVAKAEGVK